MYRGLLSISLIVLAIFLLTGCAGDQEASEELSLELLTNLHWELNQLNGKPALPMPDVVVTANFDEEGSMTGSAGCNNYTAAYEVDGDNISIKPGAMTAMSCPELVMEQERTYLDALEAAEKFEVNDVELLLLDGSGNDVAHYAATSQELAGTSWEVMSYNTGSEAVTSVITGTTITANFGEDGELTGSAGCNDYFGPYETQGVNISMGPFGTTRKACQDPEGIMEQENQYLAALETAAVYKIEGGMMEMRTNDGARAATFRRVLP